MRDDVVGPFVPVAATGVRSRKKAGPLRGRTRDSPSRFRFRPPHPTGPSPRDCSLFVRPLGRGFDLLALRARRKKEPMRTRSPDQDPASTFLSQFARIICGGRSRRCPRLPRTGDGRTSRSRRGPRGRRRRAASASGRARPTTASSSTRPAGRAPRG